MEAGFIILVAALTCVLGFFLGVLYMNASKKTRGVIHVDYSDTIDGPYLFLELNAPVADVVSEKQILLDVDTTQYYSCK